jgi:acyl carrier protein
MADMDERILTIIRKHMPQGDKPITAATPLAELEIESLDLVEIIFEIEEEFDIEIPYNANDDANFDTVGQILDRVKAIVAGS